MTVVQRKKSTIINYNIMTYLVISMLYGLLDFNLNFIIYKISLVALTLGMIFYYSRLSETIQNAYYQVRMYVFGINMASLLICYSVAQMLSFYFSNLIVIFIYLVLIICQVISIKKFEVGEANGIDDEERAKARKGLSRFGLFTIASMLLIRIMPSLGISGNNNFVLILFMILMLAIYYYGLYLLLIITYKPNVEVGSDT